MCLLSWHAGTRDAGFGPSVAARGSPPPARRIVALSAETQETLFCNVHQLFWCRKGRAPVWPSVRSTETAGLETAESRRPFARGSRPGGRGRIAFVSGPRGGARRHPWRTLPADGKRGRSIILAALGNQRHVARRGASRQAEAAPAKTCRKDPPSGHGGRSARHAPRVTRQAHPLLADANSWPPRVIPQQRPQRCCIVPSQQSRHRCRQRRIVQSRRSHRRRVVPSQRSWSRRHHAVPPWRPRIVPWWQSRQRRVVLSCRSHVVPW